MPKPNGGADRLMHAGIAACDAWAAAASGRIGLAARHLLRRSVLVSLGSIAEEARQILRLTRGRAREMATPC